ncbi:serine/arginine repetitive matrix protein 2 [Maledivibacter halophilus]|uniref:Uncharacterized protein n=1 Tax=Maledivibacter halophilus TaxID=36842 RepID=A0A1T5L735_9FIRM|nr:serine/arginine repetitive matrix protein 2 [Maledivibacter halophilus]SKC68064.1 hypothetical protein SAMN02194393_02125 [Maledivibacter halophilus]SKC71876.1 hypothetical protein SAMN02194393_02527 [Maledivibacter halophilus]SKC80111.1 hypothetical protein SAMN02194393_03436 [Maledivibacter halophilus]
MKFTEYLWYLAHRPLKLSEPSESDAYKLFKVLGNVLDQVKEKIFLIRRQALIYTASGKALDKHGEGRKLKRFAGETDESYKKRLLAKWEIAIMAGSKKAILLTLKALGYEQSYIEPFYVHDPERWAEFIIYLGSVKASDIDDIGVINKEIMKVKSASSLPSYGIEESSNIRIGSSFRSGYSRLPLCNTISCGMWPQPNNQGKAFNSMLNVESFSKNVQVKYPKAGFTNASNEKYIKEIYAQYCDFKSGFKTFENLQTRIIEYIRCNQILSGVYPDKQTIAKIFESYLEIDNYNKDGLSEYPLCGIARCEGSDFNEDVD